MSETEQADEVESVAMFLPHAERPAVARWLLENADHSWDVVATSEGFTFPGSLWDKPSGIGDLRVGQVLQMYGGGADLEQLALGAVLLGDSDEADELLVQDEPQAPPAEPDPVDVHQGADEQASTPAPPASSRKRKN